MKAVEFPITNGHKQSYVTKINLKLHYNHHITWRNYDWRRQTMSNMSVRKKYSSPGFWKGLTKTSATNLENEILKSELDQIIIKGLIDQNYKILDRDRSHLRERTFPW